MCCNRSAELQPSTKAHFVDMQGCIIVIKNVPCLECSQCGEILYINEVAKRLDEIVKAINKLKIAISVLDYTTYEANNIER